MHDGRVSSHFLRRARQVQHPVLVRVTPDLVDVGWGGDMLYNVWLVKECGWCWHERGGRSPHANSAVECQVLSGGSVFRSGSSR